MPTEAQERIRQALGPEQHRRLRAARDRIAAVIPVCDDAEACNVEVSAYRAALLEMDRRLEEIEKRFFPVDPNGVISDG